MIVLLIDVNNATYAYTIQGQGESIILLHGFTGTKETWKPFIQKWQSAYQVITIDLPGHGKTKTTTPKTIEMFVDDLQTILKQLHITAAHIVGYSMGGRVALAYTLTYPKTVLSLTLESASPGLLNHEERSKRRQSDYELTKRIAKEGIKSFVDFWENIPLFTTQKQLPIHTQEKVRLERLNQSEKGLIQSLLYMGTGQQTPLWKDLQKVETPVLLIVGKQDEKFVRINEKMAKLLPKGVLKIIDQAGHTVHLEQPEEFFNEITTFIQT